MKVKGISVDKPNFNVEEFGEKDKRLIKGLNDIWKFIDSPENKSVIAELVWHMLWSQETIKAVQEASLEWWWNIDRTITALRKQSKITDLKWDFSVEICEILYTDHNDLLWYIFSEYDPFPKKKS